VLVLECFEISTLKDILLLFGIELVLNLLVLVAKVFDCFLVFLFILAILLDSGFFLFDLLLHIFLLGIKELGVSLKLGLFFGEFFDRVLLLLDFLFLLHQVVLEFQDFLVKVGVGVLKVIILLLLHLNFLLEIFLSTHQLVNGVILSKGETRALLNNLVELGNLVLEALNDLPGLLFLVLGGLNKLPALLDLSSQDSDGVGILLGQLNGSLDSCSILQNCII
jgi:hypothetical protein